MPLMIFDVAAALAEIEALNGMANPAKRLDHVDGSEGIAPRLAPIAGLAEARNAPQIAELTSNSRPSTEGLAEPFPHVASATTTSPHGSFLGYPRTWTGRLVAPGAWRELSEWEKHGSTGKIWNGETQQWEESV